MKRFFLLLQVIAVLASATIAQTQVDWRFGLEWNEGTLLGWNDPLLKQLFGKLEMLNTPGGINVNGQGSWAEMQSSAAAQIKWAVTDTIVSLFQRYGFSFTWYLRSDAQWAFPSKQVPSRGTAAPDSAFEDHWKRYVQAVVERYDGDGIDDMPGLAIPIQFYIMIGEIRFPGNGLGDAEWGPFWFDNIDNLLRLHRITYEAVREADPRGFSQVVSSGALLWDLYADFPDYPDFDPADANSTIQRRLRGENYRGSTYTAGWDSLKKMLDSFGNDADGIECDYIGWHPHGGWRVIDQEFAFIHAHAADKPIYVDDMWANISSVGYNLGLTIPGFAQFNAPPWPSANTDWIKEIEGDFPNILFPFNDPHETLLSGLLNEDKNITAWYYANGARELVKSFASAFGKGAERVSFSGTNDMSLLRNRIYGSIGWINLVGTQQEGYAEKPQFYTLKLLVEKLSDFTTATEIAVSSNPRTRVYEFDRPTRGPVYVLWSETGDAPAELDYRIPTGETIVLKTENQTATLKLTHIITDTANTEPEEEIIPTQDGVLTIQLGYEPIFLEGDFLTDVSSPPSLLLPTGFVLSQNYPNPFNAETTIKYDLPRKSSVRIKIYNLSGQEIATLVDEERAAGSYQLRWNGIDNLGKPVASGVCILCMQAGDFLQVRKMLILR